MTDNLLEDVVDEDSTTSFSNLERRLLTAGIGVCSTSGGDIVERETTGDHKNYSACCSRG